MFIEDLVLDYYCASSLIWTVYQTSCQWPELPIPWWTKTDLNVHNQPICGPHLVDHVQGALKDGIKDLGYLTGDVTSQLIDDGRHGAEDLGLTGRRDITLVVYEDGIQKWWNEVLSNLENGEIDQWRAKCQPPKISGGQ